MPANLLPASSPNPSAQNTPPATLAALLHTSNAATGMQNECIAFLSHHLFGNALPDVLRSTLNAARERVEQAIAANVADMLPKPPDPTHFPLAPQHPSEPAGSTRRLQRAIVQAMRYRRDESQAAEGLTFQELRDLLPRRTWNPPPTDDDIRAAVAISGQRLWLEPSGANDPGLIRIFCAPKDEDPQRRRVPPGARSYSQASLSLEASSSLPPRRAEPRSLPSMPGTTPCPKQYAFPAPSERRLSSPTPRRLLRSSSCSQTPPRRTRRAARPARSPTRPAPVVTLASSQELQAAFAHFISTLNLPEVQRHQSPSAHARPARASRKHDQLEAGSDSDHAPRRTKKKTRQHAKDTRTTDR